MEYFILNKNKQVVNIDDYLKQSNISPEFARFVRREALGHVLVEQSNERPSYLKYANKLGFRWEPNADIGHVQYDYRANLIRRLVQDYARMLVQDLGMPIYEVNGANMFSLKHPVVESYAALYGDRLYQFKSGDFDVVMSYDASYPQFNLAARAPLSYKQLPFAHFSLSDCYRHEQSGEMMLLLRQRRFYMPDIHPYFKNIDEAFSWLPKMQDQIVNAAKDAGQEYQVVIEVPSSQVWEQYKSYIQEIPAKLGADVLVNIINDGQDRYWVVNVDYKIIDKLGQAREIGCIQVDIGNAPRLDIHYIDADGKPVHPVIIHSAIPGGIERFIYLLFDKFEDKGLPLWIQPIQLRILPVGADYVQDCLDLVKKYKNLPIRIEVDDRDISLSAKIKAIHKDLIPNHVVVGQKEKVDNYKSIDLLLDKLSDQVKDKPFIAREWPVEVSKQLS